MDHGPVSTLPAEPPLRALAQTWPGPAVTVAENGRIAACNDAGVPLVKLLGAGLPPTLAAAVAASRREGNAQTDSLRVPTTTGIQTVDVVIAPIAGGSLLLGRDVTLERNLREALVDSRQRYKDLVEISADFAWEVGADQTFTFVSPHGAVGWQAADLVGCRAEDFLLPDDAGHLPPDPFATEQPVEDVVLRFRQADGGIAWLSVRARPMRDRDGEWLGARGVCHDITEQRARELALARVRARENARDRIVRTIRDEVDPRRLLLAAARAIAPALQPGGCSIYRAPAPGQARPAASGGTVPGADLVCRLSSHLAAVTDIFSDRIEHWRVLGVPTRYAGEINGYVVLWRADGDPEWGEDDRTLLAAVASQIGIAARQVAQFDELDRLSRTDALTGLLNRRAFLEGLGERLDIGGGGALVYVDLDNFKPVNDVHGHRQGDAALRDLSALLTETAEEGDLVGRLGGDEFALWLGGIDSGEAEAMARRLLDLSGRLRRYSGLPDRPLGISLGVAVHERASAEPLDTLVARADAAMYRAKAAGKSCYALADAELEELERNP